MHCEYSQYFEVLHCGYCLYSKSFAFRYCGYKRTNLPMLSAFGTAHTLVTLSIWAFSVLAIFWPPVLQYSQYSDYDLFSSIIYLSVNP